MARQLLREETDGFSFSILPSDLQKKIRWRPRNNLVIFVVDASESMGDGTFSRMAAAKGAVLAILSRAYQKRDRIGLVTFGGETAQIVLRPTNSMTLARDRLQRLPTGGATPFSDGLMKAWQLVKSERIKNSDIHPLLVVISDGEANVPLHAGENVMNELLLICGKIQKNNIFSVVIDTQRLARSRTGMRCIAASLGGNYYHIDDLKAYKLIDVIRREKKD